MKCNCGNVITYHDVIGYRCDKCRKKYTYQDLKDQIEAPKGTEYKTKWDGKKFVIRKIKKTLKHLIFALLLPTLAQADYCTIKQEKFPCKIFLFIYTLDGKQVRLVIQINQDGSQELIYDSGIEEKGLEEANEMRLRN